jgi:hypothetical protein
MAKTDEVVNVDDEGWTDVDVEDAGTEEGSEFVTKAQLEEMLAPLKSLLEGTDGDDKPDVMTPDKPVRAKDVEAMIEERMQKATAWLKGEMDKKAKAPKAKAKDVTPEPEPTPVEPTKKDWRKMMWGEK